MTGTLWHQSGSVSARLYERAKSVLPFGSTRAAVSTKPFAPYAVKGAGPRIWDADGNSYLDLANNLGVLIHGHSHPRVVEAVTRQVADGACFALPTPHEVALAELLCSRVPGFERVRFINTGSEAVALALRTARAFTGRTTIAKLEGVYHGSAEFADLGVNSSPDNWGNRPQTTITVPGTPPGVTESVVVLAANDIASLESSIAEHSHDLAAIIVDPVPPRCGMQPLDPAFVDALRRIADSMGALLIYDEVIAFRFGYEGAQGRFHGQPDLTVLGKIIGGGYPVGAVAGRADVLEATAGTVASSGTFTANPVTMVAGLATMEELVPSSFEALDVQGERIRAECAALIRSAGVAMQVCGTGSVSSIYFHERDVFDYRSYFKSADETALTGRFHRQMLKQGVLIAASGTCFFSTVVGAAEEDEFLSAFEHCITRIEA